MSDTEDLRDALPDDLNASEYVGPYQFPDNSRRRRPAYLYFGIVGGVPGRVVAASRTRPGARQPRAAVGGNPVDGSRSCCPSPRVGGCTSTRSRRWSPRRVPSVSRSGMPRRSRCGAGCAAGRRGGCSSTRRRTRRGKRSLVLVDAIDGTRRRTPHRGQPRRRLAGRLTSCASRRRLRPRRVRPQRPWPAATADVERACCATTSSVASSQASAGTASIASAIAAGSDVVCISLAAIAI